MTRRDGAGAGRAKRDDVVSRSLKGEGQMKAIAAESRREVGTCLSIPGSREAAHRPDLPAGRHHCVDVDRRQGSLARRQQVGRTGLERGDAAISANYRVPTGLVSQGSGPTPAEHARHGELAIAQHHLNDGIAATGQLPGRLEHDESPVSVDAGPDTVAV